jgi:hypothetical protein
LTPANEISFVDCVNEDGEQVLHRPIEITRLLGMWAVTHFDLLARKFKLGYPILPGRLTAL